MASFTVDPETLALQVTGLLAEDGSHIRQTLLDEIETRLPRDPEWEIVLNAKETGTNADLEASIRSESLLTIKLKDTLCNHLGRVIEDLVITRMPLSETLRRVTASSSRPSFSWSTLTSMPTAKDYEPGMIKAK